MEKTIQNNSSTHHWPIVILALCVVGIFCTAMITFQVKETEYAVIKTFGKAKVDAGGNIITYAPGLHLKWPFVDQVWRHDKRLQCYELTKGHVEELTTKDHLQVVISTYVLWRIGDPAIFLKRLKSTEEVEEKLDAAVRNSRNSIVPMYNFADLVSTKNGASRMEELENRMLADIKEKTMKDFGIEVTKVGIRQLGFPELVTTTVFERMKAARETESNRLLAEGKSEAQAIRSAADREAAEILAKAEAEAKSIRGKGDEEAAKNYEVFQRNPQLALFLKNLEALRTSLGAQDTLILDTNTPPYTLLKPNAIQLSK